MAGPSGNPKSTGSSSSVQGSKATKGRQVMFQSHKNPATSSTTRVRDCSVSVSAYVRQKTLEGM